MENASKALMMAAGVLIGILILTLAVYLFIDYSHHAKQTYNQIQENQINQFNNEFISMQGKKEITIYDVVSIAKRAREYNGINDLDENNENYITVTLKRSNSSYPIEIGVGGSERVISKYTDQELQKLIEIDREYIRKSYEKDSEGYTVRETVNLPPYTCIAGEYNSMQKVTKIDFIFDKKTWEDWNINNQRP